MTCVAKLVIQSNQLLVSTVTSVVLLMGAAWAAPELPPTQSAQDLQPIELPQFITDASVQLEPMEARSPIVAQTADTPATAPPTRESTDLLDTSPVFQRWNKEVPNVLDDIRRDPAFRTRARLGLSYFPSTFDSLGWNVGIEDVFVGRTNLTVSGDYQTTFTGDRQAGGGELRYYLLPLGNYFNIAPVFGYRYLETPRYSRDGINVGARFQAVLSRTGGADISFTQTWVSPRQSEEVGISKFSFGYALTKNVRLSTDIEKQNSNRKKDTRFGISFEWMF